MILRTMIRSRQQGMTLIEILVAMTIFSVIAVMGYGGLNNVIELQGKQNEIQYKQEDLQRVLLIMARDFYQIVPRAVRDNVGTMIPAFIFDSNNNTIEFTRSGSSHPITFKRSQFQRIGYVLENDELYRQHWMHLDRPLDSIAQKYLLIRGVDSITYRFLDGNQAWHKSWGTKALREMPRAIELKLKMDDGIEFLHLFPIVQM